MEQYVTLPLATVEQVVDLVEKERAAARESLNHALDLIEELSGADASGVRRLLAEHQAELSATVEGLRAAIRAAA